ncbi:hypothetical protein [Brevibacillus laterosporus]|uniref:hypothetical protein n=1 Tax=Brevibacillus laterosporus TaxID=1465 RepID=UPI001EF34AB8|nr:hypothetical protein [Brevibacillus laterosporus]MCG7318035.1 hypothetical protein [Brevibacillus laterosporus]
MKNDPFEAFMRIQEQMNRINIPFNRMQEQISIFSQNQILDNSFRVQTNFPAISKIDTAFLQTQNVASAITSLTEMMNQSFSVSTLSQSISEMMQKQQIFLEQASISQAFNTSKLTEWNNTLNQIANSPLLKRTELIPDSIFHSVHELSTTFDIDLPEKEGNSDLSAGLPDQSEENKMTWTGLIMFLIAVFQAFAPYHIEMLNEEQQKSQMEEVKIQTTLQQDLLNTEKQRLEIEKEQLELNKKQYLHQLELEKKYDQLLKSVEPLISQNEDDHLTE